MPALLLLLTVGGCATLSLPRPQGHAPSYALSAPAETRLGGIAATESARHGGQSGFALLPSGPDALAVRSDLADLAERTLDVQYYLWDDDASGRLLTAALLRAANRGVHVRVLLDDAHTVGRTSDLALLDSHPNIEVRLFNPFANRDWRLADAVREFPRVNHRMHNKALIADNGAAVVGGRNVGDAYFTADAAANFRDLDLLAAGPVVQELSRSFDEFWNSGWSVPVRSLVSERAEPERLRRLSARLEASADSARALPFRREIARTGPDDLLRRLRDGLVWGEATVVADRPDKPETERPVLLEGLRALLGDGGRREISDRVGLLHPVRGREPAPVRPRRRRLARARAHQLRWPRPTSSSPTWDTPSGAPACCAAASSCTSCAPTRASCAAGVG